MWVDMIRSNRQIDAKDVFKLQSHVHSFVCFHLVNVEKRPIYLLLSVDASYASINLEFIIMFRVQLLCYCISSKISKNFNTLLIKSNSTRFTLLLALSTQNFN